MSAPAGRGLRECAVGAPAHGDVVIDVDELGSETLGEEPGDEQRHVPEPLQVAVALGGAWRRRQCLAQHRYQWLQPQAIGSALVQRLGAGEQSQEIYDVVLGLVLDRQVLPHERAMQCVAEEFAQVRYRLHTLISIVHRRLPPPPLADIQQLISNEPYVTTPTLADSPQAVLNSVTDCAE